MQVKELYGPLLACVTASKSAFDAMVRQHGEQCTTQEFIQAAREKPESEEAKTYRCVKIRYAPVEEWWTGCVYCSNAGMLLLNLRIASLPLPAGPLESQQPYLPCACDVECAMRCRHWMKTVLQPLNEKARDIIVNRADLLEAAAVEPLLLQLVAHVSAYRVILARSASLTILQLCYCRASASNAACAQDNDRCIGMQPSSMTGSLHPVTAELDSRL